MNHTSLAYGADWCWLPPKSLPTLKSDGRPQETQDSTANTAPSCDTQGDTHKDSNISKNTRSVSQTEIAYTVEDDLLIASCSFYDHTMQIWLK